MHPVIVAAAVIIIILLITKMTIATTRESCPTTKSPNSCAFVKHKRNETRKTE